LLPSLSCCPPYLVALPILLPSLSCCPPYLVGALPILLVPSLSCWCPHYLVAAPYLVDALHIFLLLLLPSLSCCSPYLVAALPILLLVLVRSELVLRRVLNAIVACGFCASVTAYDECCSV